MENGTKCNMIKQPSKKELNIPTVIANRWEVIEKIGHGGFGDIYKAYDTLTNDYVAVKMEKRSDSKNLQNESGYYKFITEYAKKHGIEKLIPNFIWYGREKNINAAVFDLMGQSLSVLFRKCKKNFSLKTILMVANQMVDCIQFIHRCGIVHRDIKPGNFVLGRKDKRIYIIDFGLSNFWHDKNGNHIECKTNCAFKGTYRYASRNSHFKFEQSRRDDLESLGYIIIYFMKGKLPWQNLKVNKNDRKKAIGKQKDMISIKQLTEGLPEEITTYMEYVRGLSFYEVPNYAWIKSLFENCLYRHGYVYDNVYDWDLIDENPLVKSPIMYYGCNRDYDVENHNHQNGINHEAIKHHDAIYHYTSNITSNQPHMYNDLNSSGFLTSTTLLNDAGLNEDFTYDCLLPPTSPVESSPYTTQTTIVDDDDEVCLLGESYYRWERYGYLGDTLTEPFDFDDKEIARAKRSLTCYTEEYISKRPCYPSMLKAND